jgi:hypothetical protein
MQKRDSFVAGLVEAQSLPACPNTPHFRWVGSPVHPDQRVLNGKSAAPTDHWERARSIVAKA